MRNTISEFFEDIMTILRPLNISDIEKVLRGINYKEIASSFKKVFRALEKQKTAFAISGGYKVFFNKGIKVERRTAEDFFLEEIEFISPTDIETLASRTLERDFQNVNEYLNVICANKKGITDQKKKKVLQLLAAIPVFGKPEHFKKFLILYGPRDSGKSTYMNSLSSIFGPVNVVRGSDSLYLAKKVSSHDSDLVHLMHAKLVFTSEDEGNLKNGFKLTSSKMIKRLCGEKSETARAAYDTKFQEIPLNFGCIHVTNNPVMETDQNLTEKLFVIKLSSTGVKKFLSEKGGIDAFVNHHRKEFWLWSLQGVAELFQNYNALNESMPESTLRLHNKWFYSQEVATSKNIQKAVENFVNNYYERTDDPTDIVKSIETFQHFQQATSLLLRQKKSTMLENKMTEVYGRATHHRDSAYRRNLKIRQESSFSKTIRSANSIDDDYEEAPLKKQKKDFSIIRDAKTATVGSRIKII